LQESLENVIRTWHIRDYPRKRSSNVTKTENYAEMTDVSHERELFCHLISLTSCTAKRSDINSDLTWFLW